MLMLKGTLLGVRELAAREGYPPAALIDIWSPATGTLSLWAPADVGAVAQDLGEVAPVLAGLSARTIDMRDAHGHVTAQKLRITSIRPAE